MAQAQQPPQAASTGRPFSRITSLTDQAIAFQRIASLHQLAGNPALAEKTLRSAFSVLETIRAGLELQAGSLGRPIHKGAWIEKAVAVLPGEGTSAKQLMGQVGLALHGLDPAERAGVKTGSQGQDPFLQLHEAECQYLLGKKDLSAEIARSAADEFLHQLQESRLYLGGDFTFTTDLPGFVRSLFQLDQVKEAAEVADAALRVDPSNPDLVALASQVHLANEHLSRSKELATIAAHLQPDNLDNLRHLALVCERSDDWVLACRYRKDCLEHPEGGELADQTAYARSALKAGDLLAASQMCEQILADRPDDGTVHGLMGLTRAAQGRDEEALMHFNRATLVASETAEWWLALAEQHEKMGDGRTALETLRAAVLAAPDSGDIHYRLGELYLNGGMNSEALPHLKKAAALKSENSAIAFKLAKALHALGFLSEARQVIDQLKDQWAGKPEIAFEYAVVALAMDDVDAAIVSPVPFAGRIVQRGIMLEVDRRQPPLRGRQQLAGMLEFGARSTGEPASLRDVTCDAAGRVGRAARPRGHDRDERRRYPARRAAWANARPDTAAMSAVLLGDFTSKGKGILKVEGNHLIGFDHLLEKP